MLLQIPTAVLQSLFIQLPISILFVIVGMVVFIRNKHNRIAYTMVSFLLKVGIGLFVAVLMRFHSDPEVNALGMRIGMYFISISIVDLLFFNLLILKSRDIITSRKQIIATILYWIILLPLFFNALPLEYVDRGGGLTEPVFSAEFSLYGGLISEGTFILSIIYSIQNYRSFSDKVMKRKFIQTTISISMFDWVLIGNFVFNWLDNPDWRRIFLVTSLIILPAIYLLIKGMVLNPAKAK